MIRGKLPLIIILLNAFWFIASSAVLADEGIYRDRSNITVPSTGMNMEQVKNKFGRADASLPSIGNPPITRWEYDGFTVYFEYQHVIHSVITS